MWWAVAPASAACASDGPSLRVATLNAWGLPSPVASARKARMPLIARWLETRRFDVAALEEVWRGALRLFTVPGLTTPDHVGDSGLALLTSHEVLAKRSHVFEAERGLDALKAKGVLSADLDLNGHAVTVSVTHLQAGHAERNARVRARQVDEILREVPVDQPTILLGDFNLYDDQAVDETTRERLEQAGFVDVAAHTGVTTGTYPGLPDRFDRIFVRDGSERCLVPRRASVVDAHLSDHKAVEALIAFGTPG